MILVVSSHTRGFAQSSPDQQEPGEVTPSTPTEDAQPLNEEEEEEEEVVDEEQEEVVDEEEEEEEESAPEDAVTPPPVPPASSPPTETLDDDFISEEDESDDPLAGFGEEDADFVPLEDIEEETLDPIFPAEVYPYVEWNGQFRFRQSLGINLDLGTGGTSAILPPLESNAPDDVPADSDARALWGADILARFEPTFSITEGLRLHVEADLLRNMQLGALPINDLPPNGLRPDPSRNVAYSGQFSPRDGEWFQGPLYIGEAYGEVRGFFGTFRAGRMDNHWGLGMFYNDGDCIDCNWGDSIDRISLGSSFRGLHGTFGFDYPATGLTSRRPETPLGDVYDRGQVDDVLQYTAMLEYAPKTEAEEELALKRLTEDRKPLLQGGLLFSWRTQDGTYQAPLDEEPGELIYRGLRVYAANAYGRFLYAPSPDVSFKLEAEAMGIFGEVVNITNEPVGRSTEGDVEGEEDVNCFDEDVRSAEARCTANSRDFQQYGVALRSEIELDSPVAFGIDGGFASGGSTPNWGLGPSSTGSGAVAATTPEGEVDAFRYDPDYHIDLILFRRVIGTVTNAYYIKPHIEVGFLEQGDRRLRFDLDAIISRASDQEGTPSGQSPWLGVELDGAFRFFLKDALHVGLEGGFLLPLDGLDATSGRPRYTRPDADDTTPEFTSDANASTAWLVQLQINWLF